MKKGNMLFVSGVMAGILIFTIFFDLKHLDALHLKGVPEMAAEHRLGYDLGLLPPQAFAPGNLRSAVRLKDFETAFDKIMRLLGVAGGQSHSTSNQSAGRRKVSRAEAVGKMMQTLILLETYGHIILPESLSESAGFEDFKVPPGQARVMNYLVERGVVKGFSDGKLHSDKFLTNRDCVSFIVRFYNALANDMEKRVARTPQLFLDLPLDHWIYQQLAGIDSVGGLALVDLGRSFNGDTLLSIGDFTNMIAGILVHFNRKEAVSEVRAIQMQTSAAANFDRIMLARVLAIMLRNLNHLYPPLEKDEKGAYSDVVAGSDLDYDLQAISNYGIQLGYVGGRLAGAEKITRSEAIGTIFAAIAPLVTIRSEILTSESDVSRDHLQTRASRRLLADYKFDPNRAVDVQEFATLIRQKQKRIREILERRPRAENESASAVSYKQTEQKVELVKKAPGVTLNQKMTAGKKSLVVSSNIKQRFPYLAQKLVETRKLAKASSDNFSDMPSVEKF